MLLFILAGSMSARKHQSFVGDREFTSDLHFKDNKTKKKPAHQHSWDACQLGFSLYLSLHVYVLQGTKFVR